MDDPAFLDGLDGRQLAYRERAGSQPTVVWLGGLRSDMRGTKAERLDAHSTSRGHAFLRFDYSGHGESAGRFEEGTVSRWCEDALSVIGARTNGPLILVGSSMGAWVALRLAGPLRARLARPLLGLLLLAPAPDFTSRLVVPALSSADLEALQATGRLERPSDYGEPMVYTQALIDDGDEAQVMDGPIVADCPIHIIQGMLDREVPHTHALDLVSHLPADGVVLTLVPGGDHRLSREEDLLRMEAALDGLLAQARERT